MDREELHQGACLQTADPLAAAASARSHQPMSRGDVAAMDELSRAAQARCHDPTATTLWQLSNLWQLGEPGSAPREDRLALLEIGVDGFAVVGRRREHRVMRGDEIERASEVAPCP